MAGLNIFGIPGLPEITGGTDLAAAVVDAANAAGTPLASGDVVVITSKIVSKAEGRVVDLAKVEVSPFARQYAEKWEKEPAIVELVLQESRRVVRQVGPILITETRHGFICANSGVDQSSSGGHGLAVLLPVDPDSSAAGIRKGLAKRGVEAAVIISDTFGRPWREGHVNFAIGVAGIRPLIDYAGERDPAGYELRVTMMAVVDELAAAAELVHGKLARVPVAIIRGVEYQRADDASTSELIRPAEKDMFR
jgi:coenzyme F420-0:L-glutamate ligase/coenzyme F420-1:gamma-L-glutamate ligase